MSFYIFLLVDGYVAWNVDEIKNIIVYFEHFWKYFGLLSAFFYIVF